MKAIDRFLGSDKVAALPLLVLLVAYFQHSEHGAFYATVAYFVAFLTFMEYAIAGYVGLGFVLLTQLSLMQIPLAGLIFLLFRRESLFGSVSAPKKR